MALRDDLKINDLILQNQTFAIYRLPNENRLFFNGQANNSFRIIPAIESINGQSGFVIAPFRVSEKCPIIFIETEKESVFEIPDIIESNEENENVREQPSSDYSSRFKVFSQALADKAFEKLVLSHCMIVPKNSDFSPANVFYRACKRYIRSYIYLFHTPQTGTWIGSTPELLLSGKRNKWHTVAMAGTQTLVNGKLPETWSEKKKEEQQLVTDYIRNCLLSYDIYPEEKGPYSVQAGELAHLKTDFRFSLSGKHNLGKFLNVLHPTPAVCGLPKENAFKFINENEGYDRRYYSGFIGRMNSNEQTTLYVNLRCMQIENKRLLLYAGGGLLASSDLNEEWMETEDKLQTMLRIIDN